MNDFSPALPNELMLVTQARVNTAAFAALYDHYFSRVYNYVRYRVPDADLREASLINADLRGADLMDATRPDKWQEVVAAY